MNNALTQAFDLIAEDPDLTLDQALAAVQAVALQRIASALEAAADR